MISKHVDLIAIAILLFAIAAFSSAKHVVIMTLSGPAHYLRMDEAHEVRLPEMPELPSIPRVPRAPKIPLQRD